MAIRYEIAIQNWQFEQLNDTITAVRCLSELNRICNGTYMNYDTHTKTVIASYYSDVVNVSAPESVPIGNIATMEIIIKAEEERIKNLHNIFDIMKKKEGITSVINILKGHANRQQSA